MGKMKEETHTRNTRKRNEESLRGLVRKESHPLHLSRIFLSSRPRISKWKRKLIVLNAYISKVQWSFVANNMNVPECEDFTQPLPFGKQ